MAKIAIVDDSRLARTFTVGCLKKFNHELLEVDPTSMFDVIKILRQQQPDIVLMDYLMPNCPGVSLVRACREDPVLKDARIVLITAHRDDEIQERLQGMGVDAFLHKPFEPQALLDVIQSLTDSKA